MKNHLPLIPLCAVMVQTFGPHLAYAQPDLGRERPSLMRWMSDSSPKAKKFREELTNVSAQLAQAQQKAGFANRPQEARQLQAPLPPAAENAAPDYQELALVLQNKPLGEAMLNAAKSLLQNEAVTAEQENLVRRLLAERRDVLDIVERAAAKEKCVFQRDYAKGFALTLPEYSVIRTAATLICARQALLIRDKKPLEAVALARPAYRIARHAASDPLTIAFLVGIACERLETAQLSALVRREGAREDVCRAVREAITQWLPQPDLQGAMWTEFLMARSEINKLRKASPDEWTAWLDTYLDGEVTLFPARRRHAEFTGEERRFLNTILDTAELGWLRAIQHPTPPNAPAQPQENNEENPRKNANPTEILSAFFPDFSRIRERETVPQTHKACLLAACDVLLFKARHNKLPNTLAEAGIPHENLIYRRENDSFTIESAKIAPQETAFRYP